MCERSLRVHHIWAKVKVALLAADGFIENTV